MADEKKGGISGFFKKVGDKINDATYEMRAISAFNGEHKRYCVYTGASLISHTAELYCEEHFGGEENYVVAPADDDEILIGHIIVSDETGDARYIAAVEKTKITFEFEGKQNEKPALKITLGEPAEMVDVIKAGDKYYLKK